MRFCPAFSGLEVTSEKPSVASILQRWGTRKVSSIVLSRKSRTACSHLSHSSSAKPPIDWPLPYLADVLRMIEAEPELALKLRRVRGGYLKIQGTWLPFEVTALLSICQSKSLLDSLSCLSVNRFRSRYASHDGQWKPTVGSHRRKPFR